MNNITVKSIYITTLLVTFWAAHAMDGADARSKAGAGQYNTDKGVMTGQLSKQNRSERNWLPPEVTKQIQQKGLALHNLNHFTCPAGEQVDQAIVAAQSPNVRIKGTNGSQDFFVSMNTAKGPFKFKGILIENTMHCLYKHGDHGLLYAQAISQNAFLDEVEKKCQLPDQKFLNGDKDFIRFSGLNGYKVYTSENPYDLTILCG